MYPNFLNDLKRGKKFPKVGAGRSLNVRVILDNKLIYDGPVESASANIKNLYYYKADLKSGKFIFYVDSEMCKMIDKRDNQSNPILEQKKVETVIVSKDGKIEKNTRYKNITKEDFLIENVDKNYEKLDFSDKNIKDMSEMELDSDIRLLFNQEMNRYDMDRDHYGPLNDYYDDYRKNSPGDIEFED